MANVPTSIQDVGTAENLVCEQRFYWSNLMNILLITTHLNIGGIAVYTVSLSKALKGLGNNIIVASDGGELLSELESDLIRHIRIPIKTKSILNPLLFVSASRLYRTLNELHFMPDIIHSQTRVSGVVALYISKLLKIPFITTCHGFFYKNMGRRLFPNWGMKVIAISKPVQEHLIKEFKMDKEKIQLIQNGIDILRFSTPATVDDRMRYKRIFNIDVDSTVVGVISRLVPGKGHDIFLEAFKEVVLVRPSVSALISGDGILKAQLKRLARDLGVQDRVIFTGTTLHTDKVLSIVDIFVFPSMGDEGFGLSMLEAMAMEVPVIAFNSYGMADIIDDGKTGILVLPGDRGGLANAIISLLDDIDKAGRIGKASRRVVQERFSIERMAIQTEKVYRETIQEFRS